MASIVVCRLVESPCCMLETHVSLSATLQTKPVDANVISCVVVIITLTSTTALQSQYHECPHVTAGSVRLRRLKSQSHTATEHQK